MMKVNLLVKYHINHTIRLAQQFTEAQNITTRMYGEKIKFDKYKTKDKQEENE